MINEAGKTLSAQHRDGYPGRIPTDRSGSGVLRGEAIRDAPNRPRSGCGRCTGGRTRHGRLVGGRLREVAEAREVLTTAVREGNRSYHASSRSRGSSLSAPVGAGGDELTPTMKLERRPIAEKYSTESTSSMPRLLRPT